MLAANAEFDIRAGFAATFRANRHQSADAFNINRNERIDRVDISLRVIAQELARVIAADPQRGLRHIIGAEREKLSFFGDLIRHQRCPRQFDHRSHHIGEGDAGFSLDGFSGVINDFAADFDLASRGGKRHHNLRHDRIRAFFLHHSGGFKNRPRLHRADFRIGDRQTTPAMPKHGIVFRQFE